MSLMKFKFTALLFLPVLAGASDVSRQSFVNSRGVEIGYVHIEPTTAPVRGTAVIFVGMSMTASKFIPLGEAEARSGMEVFILEPRYSHRYSILPGQNPGSSAQELIDEDFAELVAKVESLATNAQFHWIGHSFGGMAAMSVLSRREALGLVRPASLTIIGATNSFQEMRPEMRAANLLSDLNAILFVPPWIHSYPMYFSADWGSIPLDLGKQISERDLLDSDRRPLIDVERITVPTLVAIAGEDQFLGVDIARSFADRLPAAAQARFAQVPGYTHFSILDAGLSELWPEIHSIQARKLVSRIPTSVNGLFPKYLKSGNSLR